MSSTGRAEQDLAAASSSGLVERAERYATQAHERIDHRRKYSDQPYQVHLKEVAGIVATVTDDPVTLAAAWLHDVVEDTPATLGQIEQEFGPEVATLVRELTDVSRPGDGNRAQRKALDRAHLAQASAPAQTVKLADLIDNCRDITRNDPRFAKVFLVEMAALLEVLDKGDGRLLKRAWKVHARSVERVRAEPVEPPEEVHALAAMQPVSGLSERQFRRMYTELFTARDIAEPLLSFDEGTHCALALEGLQGQQQTVASVRSGGRVSGFVRVEDLQGLGRCGDVRRRFRSDQLVHGSDPLSEVIHVLTRHDFCFVELLGQPGGVIRRDDINKPMVRMWLFGIITLIEMMMVRLIEEHFPGDSWQAGLTEQRLDKALRLREERLRRNQHCDLVDCLQFSDKGQILIGYPPTLKWLGFESRRSARKAIRGLESLRNNLAHAQDIVAHDWAQIARLTSRMVDLGD